MERRFGHLINNHDQRPTTIDHERKREETAGISLDDKHHHTTHQYTHPPTHKDTFLFITSRACSSSGSADPSSFRVAVQLSAAAV
ncbi:hypothetical protein CF336_g9379 [Tilletia laevis]|uniref:Uncharacterized protein n=1 Tax=Tilletia caries TaxID=13290 RepID=A0A177V5K0_9BASI|nr:hypothetical protein CF336_g9379 [Tilletia laevis]KAE8261795.1 hypothetical protein A4X03_0g2956 [Tilletia caries]